MQLRSVWHYFLFRGNGKIFAAHFEADGFDTADLLLITRDAKAYADNQLASDATDPAAAALTASARVRFAARCVGRGRA